MGKLRFFDRRLPLGVKVATPLVALAVVPALLAAVHLQGLRHRLAERDRDEPRRLTGLVVRAYRAAPDDAARLGQTLATLQASIPQVHRIRVWRLDGAGPSLWVSSDPGEPQGGLPSLEQAARL